MVLPEAHAMVARSPGEAREDMADEVAGVVGGAPGRGGELDLKGRQQQTWPRGEGRMEKARESVYGAEGEEAYWSPSNGSWLGWPQPSRAEKEEAPALPGSCWPLRSWVFIPVSDGKSPKELDSQCLQFSTRGGPQ